MDLYVKCGILFTVDTQRRPVHVFAFSWFWIFNMTQHAKIECAHSLGKPFYANECTKRNQPIFIQFICVYFSHNQAKLCHYHLHWQNFVQFIYLLETFKNCENRCRPLHYSLFDSNVNNLFVSTKLNDQTTAIYPNIKQICYIQNKCNIQVKYVIIGQV